MIFKYTEYKNYLSHLKRLGEIFRVGDWAGSNNILLRHDVDFSVEAAHRLAMVEAECDVRSSFFFLTTCHTYNPSSIQNRAKLREMGDLGFEIGLHFDPSVYGNANEKELANSVDQEAELLSRIAAAPVRSISLHNPSEQGKYPLFEGYHNAYDPRIFSDSCYLTDSRMDFRGKDPYTFVQKVKEHPVQILLHPLHFSETGHGYRGIFCNYLKEYTEIIDCAFRVNSTYAAEMPESGLMSYISGTETI